MGQDPHAVVDADLRVHGLKGLRIVDASVMPRITSGNTASPVIMIAEKAADMIPQTVTTMRSRVRSDRPAGQGAGCRGLDPFRWTPDRLGGRCPRCR